MKNLLLIMIFSAFAAISAQPPSIEWQKCLGGTAPDGGSQTVISTSDGGFLVAGQVLSPDGDVSGNHGLGDAWVVKLDASGTLQWQRCYGGSNWEYGGTVVQTSDGGFVMCCYTYSNDGRVR